MVLWYGPRPRAERNAKRRKRASRRDLRGLRSGLIAAAAAGAQGSSPRHASVGPTLELYALESNLASARARVAALDRRRRAARGRAGVQRGVDSAPRPRRCTASQSTLATLVRRLYVAGETDPIAIVLGAGSLDEALTGIDSLRRTARQSRDGPRPGAATRRTVAAQARDARRARAASSRDSRQRRARRPPRWRPRSNSSARISPSCGGARAPPAPPRRSAQAATAQRTLGEPDRGAHRRRLC